MRKLDLVLQSLFVLVGVAIALGAIFTWDRDLLFFLLPLQMILGPYQIIGAVINLMFPGAHRGSNFKQHLLVYLGLSIAYFSFLGIATEAGWPVLYSGHVSYLPTLVMLPWTLGLYYYHACWKKVLDHRPSQGKFLPHVGF